VVSWAHGTTGIADVCAPSLDASRVAPLANPLLAEGYVVVASDYEGLGTPGRHPYIVGESEGRGVLDIVRAARQMPEVEAGERYLIWGHSQGGHAALYAGHVAEEWAPELDLVGVVAGAPPSQLQLLNAALQASPFRHYIGMVAAGFNAAYGDGGAPLDDVLTPAGLEWLDQVDELCSADLGRASIDLDFSTIQKADPATVPAWDALLEENDPGRFTTPIPAPLLVIHGGSDEQIPTASSGLLFTQLCAIDQVAQRWVYPEQTHAGVVVASLGDMVTWIGHRFAGEPAPDPMQPVGPPIPETQSCPAA
jgi:alpha-beta hydrolase superfamily lysophospholipase